MSKRFYDTEFSPGILAMLKERDILMRANRAQGFILVYNLTSEVELLIRRFEEERKANPVLETTPPEAWIAAKLVPSIRETRPNIDTDDELLSEAMQKTLRRFTPVDDMAKHGEQVLRLTIEPYRTYLETLFLNLFDRTKSLRAILGLRWAVFGVRDLEPQTRPFSRREDIIVRGLRGKWSNRRIATALDEAGIRPRSPDRHKSYVLMLKDNSQCFYSLKNAVKTKYRANLADSLTTSGENLN
jgi:Arc/MetJ family transcription regulator